MACARGLSSPLENVLDRVTQAPDPPDARSFRESIELGGVSRGSSVRRRGRRRAAGHWVAQGRGTSRKDRQTLRKKRFHRDVAVAPWTGRFGSHDDAAERLRLIRGDR